MDDGVPILSEARSTDVPQVSMSEIFWYFLKLGWLAFGGPVGQIGLMHLQLVERRRWIGEDEFVRALNFCHLLPGPEALQLVIYVGWKKAGTWAGILAGVLFILPGFVSLTALAWIYVHFGKTPEVLGVLWGFRPVGLALLLAALVRISRAALKGVFPAALAIVAFVAFYFARLPFLVVLLGCGFLFIAWKRMGPGTRVATAAASLLVAARAEAAGSMASRLLDVSWFFLKVGLFSFGGAYAVLPYIREGAVATYGWISDRQMIDALALGETTPGPLISIGIFVGFLAGNGAGAPWLGAIASTFWLFLPSFLFVLPAARYMNWLTSRPGLKEFLRGVTCGVVGLIFSISIPLAKVAFMPGGTVDWVTVVLGVAAFAALTFWKWRLNVVAVILGGGMLGLLRAFAPALFGGALSLVLLVPAARAQAHAPAAPPAITASKDFPQGTATPSAECGACHQAIYREYAEGFGSDMRYPGVKLRSIGDKVLTMPAGTSVSASAHAAAGVDPWPIHAREAEEEGKKCNVCHFPQPFAIPDRAQLEIAKPAPRAESQGEGITCAACHLTPEGKIRGPHQVQAPHETVADERMSSSEMCAFCHALGKRVPGKQTQTYLEWRDDFAAPGLGRQQCQDCHMPRTQRKTAEDPAVPVRAVARHLWTGGHSGQRLGSALSLVLLQPQPQRPEVELHVVNVGAGHSVPTGSNRRAIYLQARVVDRAGKAVATREWMFAPWYGPRPDDRSFLGDDEKRTDRISAMQADAQGPHEPPIRAGEERVLAWQPALRDGSYTVEATLVYDLNRYNDRSFKGDQREISRFTLPLPVKVAR